MGIHRWCELWTVIRRQWNKKLTSIWMQASYITHKKIRTERAISQVTHSVNTQWELIKSAVKVLDDWWDCYGECGPKMTSTGFLAGRSHLKGVFKSAPYLRRCCPWRSQSGWWPAVDPPGRLRCHPVGDPLRTGQRSPGQGCCWSGSCCCCLVAGCTGWC